MTDADGNPSLKDPILHVTPADFLSAMRQFIGKLPACEGDPEGVGKLIQQTVDGLAAKSSSRPSRSVVPVDFSSLGPSQIEALMRERLSEGRIEEIAAGVRCMLDTIQYDGGASSDEVYAVGRILAGTGVWEQVAPAVLAEALNGADPLRTRCFLDGVGTDYAAAVSAAIDALRP